MIRSIAYQSTTSDKARTHISHFSSSSLCMCCHIFGSSPNLWSNSSPAMDEKQISKMSNDQLSAMIWQNLRNATKLKKDVILLSNNLVKLTREIERAEKMDTEEVHKNALIACRNKSYEETKLKKNEILQLLNVAEQQCTSLMKRKSGLYLFYNKDRLLQLNGDTLCPISDDVRANFPEILRKRSEDGKDTQLDLTVPVLQFTR